MTEEELRAKEASWTVRDSDGVDHRAIRMSTGSFTWVITACSWWQTHNVSGQKARVRTDRVPTCLECTMLEIKTIGEPRCMHCGHGKAVHNIHMHMFEGAS